MPHLTSYGVLIVKAQRGGGRREGHTTATGADAAVDVLLRANGNGRWIEEIQRVAGYVRRAFVTLKYTNKNILLFIITQFIHV